MGNDSGKLFGLKFLASTMKILKEWEFCIIAFAFGFTLIVLYKYF